MVITAIQAVLKEKVISTIVDFVNNLVEDDDVFQIHVITIIKLVMQQENSRDFIIQVRIVVDVYFLVVLNFKVLIISFVLSNDLQQKLVDFLIVEKVVVSIVWRVRIGIIVVYLVFKNIKEDEQIVVNFLNVLLIREISCIVYHELEHHV